MMLIIEVNNHNPCSQFCLATPLRVLVIVFTSSRLLKGNKMEKNVSRMNITCIVTNFKGALHWNIRREHCTAEFN